MGVKDIPTIFRKDNTRLVKISPAHMKISLTMERQEKVL